jgi:hypothetical protein
LPPAGAAPNAAFPTAPVVTAEDGAGNIVTNYNGTVALSIEAGTGTSGASLTGCSAVNLNGATTFTGCKIDKPGTGYVLVASDGTLSVESSPFDVTAGAAASLTVSGFPSPTGAGVNHTFTVTAKDAAGNVATGYRGTVHFTSSDGTAALPLDYTFTAADAGTHTFSATLKTLGTQSLTATDTATSAITGSQTGITVTVGPAASFAVTGYPSPTVSGTSHNFTVTARDALGNVATGYTGTVHFTSTDGLAGLPANYTFVAADNGTHTFTATLKTLGAQSITATDTAAGSITGSQTGISVTADTTPPTFAITQSGANVTTNGTNTVIFTKAAGSSFTITATDPESGIGATTFPTCPAGWTRTTGTNSVTCTDTTSAVAGNMTVLATNGAGATTNLTVTITLDNTAPTVVSSTRVGASPTNTPGNVSWTVTFSEPVTGVAPNNFTFSETVTGTPAVTSVTGSGTTWTVTASTGTGDGTIQLQLTANLANIKDAVGNALTAAFTTGDTYTFARSAPIVSAINLLGSTPTNAASVQWTVTFSRSVTGVDSTDFMLPTTGAVSGAAITAVTGSGTTYTVTAGTGVGSGTLGLNLVDNDSITDSVGNPLGGSGAGNGNFTGQTYTIDGTPPTPVSAVATDDGNLGQLASKNSTHHDQLALTYSETIAAGSITTGNISVTFTNDDPACNGSADSLSIPGVGKVCLGSQAWLTATSTTTESLSVSGSVVTLTITTSPTGNARNVAASNFTWSTSGGTATDLAGNVATGSVTTNSQRF